MKKNIFSILASAAVLAGVASCDSYEPVINGGKEGKLNTSSIAVEVSNAEKIINDGAAALKGSRAVVDLSNYIVTVVDANGMPVQKWTYSSMPELPTFTEGNYTVKVASGEEPVTAEWDAPWFRGEQSFTIKADDITDVAVVKCVLSNIRVTVKFTDELVKASAGDLKVVVRSEGAQSLTWTPSETRSGYFAAVDGLETLSVSFSGTVNGTEEKFTKALTDVTAGQHRIISFGLKTNPNLPPVPSGSIDPTEGIYVSTDVTEEDLTADVPFEEEVLDPSDRPGQEGDKPGTPDDPNPPTPPVGDAIKFSSAMDDLEGLGYVYDLDEYVANGYTADLTVDVPAGIASMMVRINSELLPDEALRELGITTEFDLVNPEAWEAESFKIQGLGFPVGDDVKNKTHVSFDITGFLELLQGLGSGDSFFVITVTDNDGNSSSTSLKFNKK